MNEGESTFVKYLKEYIIKNGSKLKGLDLYLLRNKSQTGVGFYLEDNRFYPDFILWLLKRNKQKIVFLDPKGILIKSAEKIKFKEKVKDIEKILKNSNITLEAFIISVTKFDDFKKGQILKKTKDKWEEDYHILFMKDDKEKVIERMFEYLL